MNYCLVYSFFFAGWEVGHAGIQAGNLPSVFQSFSCEPHEFLLAGIISL